MDFRNTSWASRAPDVYRCNMRNGERHCRIIFNNGYELLGNCSFPANGKLDAIFDTAFSTEIAR